MAWMPCPNYSCSENVAGQCFGEPCGRGVGDFNCKDVGDVHDVKPEEVDK